MGLHLYPFNLNSKLVSSTVLSSTTPPGHAPRIDCRIAGVLDRGGEMTLTRVAVRNETANGVRMGTLRETSDPLISAPVDVLPIEVDIGFEKLIARLSSFSPP